MAKKQAAAPQVQNAAPGYDPYARPPGGAPPAAGVMAPGGPYAPPANGAAYITAPPARAAVQPFVNAQFLWSLGRPFKATIKGVRDATGTGKDFAGQTKRIKRAWFLDFILENNQPVTGRINEGDTRHQRLWKAYQSDWIDQEVILRLTTPGDLDEMTGQPSKAAWMLDAQ
jgi:hypothetical protein